MGWRIKFIRDYDGYKTGDILSLDEAGLAIYYCSIRKVAVSVY